MTIFVAALSIERRRLQENRLDLLFCCVKSNDEKPRRDEIIRPLFQKHYVPLLYKMPTNTVILYDVMQH